MTNIYNENLEHIVSLNYDYEIFRKDPYRYYPEWETSYYASPTKYEYPILDNGVIREMSRREKILNLGMEDLLDDGEYIQAGEIVKIEYDESLGYHRKAWDKEAHIWYEATTQEEFREMRTKKILEYSELEENKKALENSKFIVTDEIELIIKKMELLEEEINKLELQVQNLGNEV